MPGGDGYLYGLPRMPKGYLPGVWGFKGAFHKVVKYIDPDELT